MSSFVTVVTKYEISSFSIFPSDENIVMILNSVSPWEGGTA